VFVGHFAAGLAAKRIAPTVNLGWLVAAGTLLDVVWPVLLLAGVEHARIVPGFTAANALDLYDYPWSHSALLALAWAAAAGGAWWAWRRDRRGALAIAAAVSSHWLLDLASHVPDLPLWPGGTVRVGLGLWRSVAATAIVEGGLLWIGGVALYATATRASDRTGRWALWSWVALLTVAYAASLAGGPPPPDIRVVAWTNVATTPLLLWPAWADRHREPAAG
jgi:hypothetical protein